MTKDGTRHQEKLLVREGSQERYPKRFQGVLCAALNQWQALCRRVMLSGSEIIHSLQSGPTVLDVSSGGVDDPRNPRTRATRDYNLLPQVVSRHVARGEVLDTNLLPQSPIGCPRCRE